MSAYYILAIVAAVLFLFWKVLQLTFDALSAWQAAARREDSPPDWEREH